jgi:hypothetical protein
VSGQKAGKPCAIPFRYEGQTYYTCILKGAPDGKPWCSTKVDRNGVHIHGEWGHCECRTRYDLVELLFKITIVLGYNNFQSEVKAKNLIGISLK